MKLSLDMEKCRLGAKKNGEYYNCCGGDINNGCPLSFKYKVKV